MAAELAAIGQQLVSKLQVVPLQSIQRAVYGLLSLWLLYAIVQMVGLLIIDNTGVEEVAVSEQQQPVVTAAPDIDIERLQSLNLFGQLGEQPVVDVVESMPEVEEVNAVKTKLNLELQGIISASETSSAVAIIVHRGQQEQYHVGDKLPAGNRVILAKVLVDHVILDNKGQYESLWLYDDSNSVFSGVPVSSSRPVTARTAQPSPRVADMRGNRDATKLAKDYRQRLYKNPKSLAEVLRIAPAQKSGQMIGYRVSPGRDRKQFTQLGFRANDIVTSINDISLDEPSQALEVYKLMRTATEASFTVLRNGQTVQLMVTLGENDS